ncbi:MAG TPA: aminoglycoside phosphotransferase [Streptosporangiaceae bacterium]|jgi:hypothetical protein
MTPTTARKDPSPGDGTLRLRYLAEVSELLWPAPVRAGLGQAGGSVLSEFVLVPDGRRPRLLVPAAHRRAAAAAVRRYAEPGSVKQRLMLRALSAALVTGLGGVAMRQRFRVCADDPAGPVDTIETYLRDALDADLVVSLAIGPARANRKPVLQLLTPGGETIGFAKLGVNDLTRSLAVAEGDSLRALAAVPLRHLTVPEVLHHGRWNGLEVLVLTPLRVWEPRVERSPARLAAAMLEIAEIGKVTEGPLRDSAYWIALGDRLAALADGDAVRSLRQAYARIGVQAGETRLRYGSWHGDWTPWNMATLRDTLLVWDWERFADDVPLGFDAVHYDFQSAVVRQGADPAVAVTETVERAAELLTPFGVTAAARLTALLYLTDIATRYLQDEQAEAGARLGKLGQWLLPVLIDQVERLHVG